MDKLLLFTMFNTRQYFLYTIYGIMVTVIFIYVLFPSETVKAYLIQGLNRSNPDLSMTIDRIKPVFPPGIKLSAIDLYRSGKSLMDVGQITIRPKYLSLFGENQSANFTGDVYGGNFKGTAVLLTREPEPVRPMEINADFSGIQIEQIPFFETVFKRKISGRLQGKVLYKGKELAGTLTGNIILADSTIALPTSVFNLDHLTFESIEADLAFQSQMLQVKNCTLTGQQVKGSFSGFIRINTPFKESGINLSGTFKPQPSFIPALTQNIPKGLLPITVLSENGFTIRLRGTFAEPGYTVR